MTSRIGHRDSETSDELIWGRKISEARQSKSQPRVDFSSRFHVSSPLKTHLVEIKLSVLPSTTQHPLRLLTEPKQSHVLQTSIPVRHRVLHPIRVVFERASLDDRWHRLSDGFLEGRR